MKRRTGIPLLTMALRDLQSLFLEDHHPQSKGNPGVVFTKNGALPYDEEKLQILAEHPQFPG